jgi:hypothetical protein
VPAHEVARQYCEVDHGQMARVDNDFVSVRVLVDERGLFQ